MEALIQTNNVTGSFGASSREQVVGTITPTPGFDLLRGE